MKCLLIPAFCNASSFQLEYFIAEYDQSWDFKLALISLFLYVFQPFDILATALNTAEPEFLERKYK